MEISSSQPHPIASPFHPQKPGAHQESSLSSKQKTENHTEIAKLRKQDQEVRRHEQAHAAAAGGLAKGGATFSYQRGPDGKQYAVGGEVKIDTSPISGNPEATIRKAKQIRAAALAPADPSAQDRAVAASATALEARAQQELREEEPDTTNSEKENPNSFLSPRIDLFV